MAKYIKITLKDQYWGENSTEVSAFSREIILGTCKVLVAGIPILLGEVRASVARLMVPISKPGIFKFSFSRF